MEVLYHSTHCTIVNYLCACVDCALSGTEYQDHFSFCFVRKGNFSFKTYNRELDSYTGRILINKPGYEYRVEHVHAVPDECTIFTFSGSYYEELKATFPENLNGFLEKDNIQSILIKSSVTLDYLHHQIVRLAGLQSGATIQIDTHLADFVERVFQSDSCITEVRKRQKRQNQYRLNTIEKAKDFIQENLAENLSLDDISHECAMSPFHFARTFKSLVDLSPYQYLVYFRLQHAENLLRNSENPIADVGYLSGFNNHAHFTFAFTEKHGIPPSAYRNRYRSKKGLDSKLQNRVTS